MKKILLLIPAFLLAFQISKAQTEKGSQTLGLDLGFSHASSNNSFITPGSTAVSNLNGKRTSFLIGPNYSYFIADKLDIGTNLYYATGNQTNGSNLVTRQHTTEYSAKVFLRKYFMYNDKIGIRTGPYIGYGRSNYKFTYDDPNYAGSNTNSKTDGYMAGVNLGLVYYPSKKFGVAATLANLNYNHYKSKDPNGQQSGSGDSVDFRLISNDIAISVFYTFGK
ncbi:hypothetical protein [Mucilaginibacter sp.]|uniref:hypothetical protein n=1 Tax=Mucilaginibacter sp. TaxID=1882438 RepID=UPI0025DF047B|nr:hypothetical protein [Mucilaginibacter sp.]